MFPLQFSLKNYEVLPNRVRFSANLFDVKGFGRINARTRLPYRKSFGVGDSVRVDFSSGWGGGDLKVTVFFCFRLFSNGLRKTNNKL